MTTDHQTTDSTTPDRPALEYRRAAAAGTAVDFNATPAANKGGAPLGNTNATRHGLRGLRSDQAGDGFEYQDEENRQHNKRNTAAAIVVHGEPLPHFVLALLQSAGRHNLRALLAAKYLRSGKDLSAADRLNMLETIGRATDQRDRCLKSAGLAKTVDAEPANPWAALDMAAVDAAPPPKTFSDFPSLE